MKRDDGVGQGQSSWTVRATAALAALGVAALVAGVVWWQTSTTDSGLAYGRLRDTVTVQARQDIVVLTSLDTKDLQRGLEAWQSVSTGVLHDQLATMPDTQKKLLTDSGATTTGKVIDAVVSELDDRAGTALVLAAVELTVVGKDGNPSVKRNRYKADVQRDGDRWKLAQLQQVAVNAS